MVNYVFDVDGTLTPSRGKMSQEFAECFFDFLQGRENVYLLTGSDKDKTIEQIGYDLWSMTVAYQCAGNVIYAYGRKVYEIKWPDWRSKVPLVSELEKLWKSSSYHDKLGVEGNHIEIRKGMVNFSTIGRNCSQEQREAYFEWDNKNKERKMLASYIERVFPGVEATVGGEISIDICPAGKNKGQVYDWLKDEGPIYFFGDTTKMGGNDYALASRLEAPHKVFQVSGPEETLEILKSLK